MNFKNQLSYQLFYISLFTFIVLFIFCSPEETIEDIIQTFDGNVYIYVGPEPITSSSSVSVTIDSRPAFQWTLKKSYPGVWKEFRYKLGDGTHSLVCDLNSSMKISGQFTVDSLKWIKLYYFRKGTGIPQFVIDCYDTLPLLSSDTSDILITWDNDTLYYPWLN